MELSLTELGLLITVLVAYYMIVTGYTASNPKGQVFWGGVVLAVIAAVIFIIGKTQNLL